MDVFEGAACKETGEGESQKGGSGWEEVPGAIMGDPTHDEVVKKIPDTQGRSGSHP